MVFEPSYPEKFISVSVTATADSKFTLVTAEMWLEDVNIHCETNDAKYGSRSEQEAQLSAGDVLSYRVMDLNSIYFKNYTAGSNTVIRAVGVIIPPNRLKVLGIK